MRQQINKNVVKSDFGKSALSFLGYHISTDGIKSLSDRVLAIQNYILFRKRLEISDASLVFKYYRRLLSRTASTQQVLFNNTKGAKGNGRTPLTWNDEEEKAF